MKIPTDDMQVVDFDPAEVDEFAKGVFDQLVTQLRDEKIDACKRKPDDIPAQILYLPMQRSALYYVLPMTAGFNLPMQELVQLTLVFLGHEIGEPRLIGFGADAAMRIFPDKGSPPNVQRGSILAALGRDPDVREALTATVIHRRHAGTELRGLAAIMPYHYERRKLVWDDDDGYRTDSLDSDGETVAGGIEEIIRAAFVKGGN